ncbi:Spore maturation protein SpmA [Fibrobacter intestinalis]|uniref:Spore maturation protein SpmA n=1 Tax=Fibrobacter intestinalis TaxID=28122 RepID=A0A1M6TTP5_9BACT|nr:MULTISPECIES: nucleoside recognition domain-containing protein [Fibrobacter]MDD7297994.1 nucleoside recognition domain-containing protein [Fibrobacter intestinalis]PBC68484.1 spore maturation protein SpmA [Fibrobacter sp. UWS1]SHK60372.1 Spore maturation protein SpmA [Fibrobacter intestinalis]
MILNAIWLLFFFGAFIACIVQWLALGNSGIFNSTILAAFDMSKTAFEIALGLTGVLSLWLGILKIGEKAGAIQILAKLVQPLFTRLFPEIPKGHPVFGTMLMNISANMLGLDNAATPMGLKAMKQLQELNPNTDKTVASDSQILFLVLNASGLTLIPVSIMTYRAQLGAANPSDIFLPILLSTFFSTLAGIIAISFFQKIKIKDPVTLAWIAGLSALVIATLAYFSRLTAEALGTTSLFVSGIILFGVIIIFLGLAIYKKIRAYEAFVEGAKEGFQTAVMVIPYLVAILVGVAVFRASGAMDLLMNGISHLLGFFGIGNDVVPALPTALMKPLSGSGSRGMMIDAMKTLGPDSFAGRLSCMFQGAADTTFYIIAVYFGSVGVRKTRHAVTCALIADLVGIIAAISIAYIFFPPI